MGSLKGLVSFLIIAVVLYLVMMFSLSKMTWNDVPLIYRTNDFYKGKGGSTYEKFKAFDKSKSYDMLFVGSSRTLCGYNPAVFERNGYSSWNLGTVNQDFSNSYQIIKHNINKDNCKLLVLDLYQGSLAGPSLESSTDLIQNVDNDKAALDIAMNMKDSRALNLFLTRAFTKSTMPFESIDTDLIKGYKPNDGVLDPTKFVSQNDSLNEFISRDELQVEFLVDILMHCDENEIEVAVVFSPSSDYYSHKNHKELMEVVKPVFEKFNTPFYDYSKSLIIDVSKHFFDAAHVNSAGARIFNEQLILDLKQDGVLGGQ